MIKHFMIGGLATGALCVAISNCERPTGRIKPLSVVEQAAVLAPSTELADLEARLTFLERSSRGTAVHNRLDAGDINQAVTPTMRAELVVLEQEWVTRQQKMSARLTDLRHRMHGHP